MKKLFTFLALLLCAVANVSAADEITVKWLPNDMTAVDLTGSASVSDILTVSDITLASDVQSESGLGTWDTKKWVIFTSKVATTSAGPKNGINKNDYLTFTVTVKSGYKFTPTGITAYAVGSGTGNNGVGIFTAIQAENKSSGYAAKNSSGASSVEQMTKAVVSSTLEAGETYTFYIYFSQNNTTANKGVGIRDVVLSGTYVDASAPIIVGSDASIKAVVSGVETTTDISVTGENLSGSTLTATLSPSVPGLSVTLANDVVTAGAISTTATIHYTATENSSGSTTLTLSDGKTSENYTITYSSLFTVKPISGSTTFDLSKVGTDHSAVTPDSYVILANAGATTSFAENLAVKGVGSMNVTWRSDAVQAGFFKFNTTLPGVVTVKWSDTGGTAGGTRSPRYINVNGVTSDVYSNGSSGDGAQVTCSPIAVEAGEVVIKGYQYNSDGDNYTDNQIRAFNITFTPTETATISAAKYATYVPTMKVAVPDGVSAYKVSATATEATLTPLTVIPAGEPVVIYKDVDADTEVTFTATAADASDVTGNELHVSATNVTADGTQYVLAKPAGKEIGFYKAASGTTIAAGKAYLVSPSGAPCFVFNFDGSATGIEAVEAAKSFDGAFYNLAGQRVSQPTRGLYIVNGKKVVIK